MLTQDNRFDFFKHLTTLNFAAIGVLMLTIQHDLIKVPKDQALGWPFLLFGS